MQFKVVRIKKLAKKSQGQNIMHSLRQAGEWGGRGNNKHAPKHTSHRRIKFTNKTPFLRVANFRTDNFD